MAEGAGAARRDRANPIREAFGKILEGYRGAREKMPFVMDQPLRKTFRRAAELLRASAALTSRPRIEVIESTGVGEWAAVPWIGMIDEGEAASVERGVSVTFLFPAEMNGVYLTILQTIAEPRKQTGRPAALGAIERRAPAIRERVADLSAFGFRIEEPIAPEDEISVGADYQLATAAYKFYPAGSLPDDRALLADVDAALGAYERYAADPILLDLPDASAWIFQSNPKAWDLDGALASLDEFAWPVRQYRERVHAGDAVFLWRSGAKDCGVVATAEVLTEPAKMQIPEGEKSFIRAPEKFEGPLPLARVRVTEVLPELLPKAAIKEHPELAKLSIMGSPMGTNFPVSAAQAAALRELVKRARGPVPHVARPGFDRLAALTALCQAIERRGYSFEPWQVAAYVTALRTKPFVILAGVSGTGKSRLPALVAEITGGEAQLLPVRPDWTDSTDVLGYVDLAGGFRPGPLLELARDAATRPDRHHVCVIDEMNLARVEQYFAEVLSRIEDRRETGGGFETGPLLTLRPGGDAARWAEVGMPPNLAVVGTVNMDETTHGFSRKVLDRAFTLEISDIDLGRWSSGPAAPRDEAPWPDEAFRPRAVRLGGLSVEGDERRRVDECVGVLSQMNRILAQAQLQVGYRTRDEIALFLLHAREVEGAFVTRAKESVDPLDLALQMKILPRIVGGSASVRAVVLELLGWAHDGKARDDEAHVEPLLREWKARGRPAHLAGSRYPRMTARLALMWERLIVEGYTSFWA